MPARLVGTARVAIVGASTDHGTQLRASLAASRVDGSRVNLFGAGQGETVVSDYAGEARLVQDPQPEEIAAHDVVFLCAGGEVALRVADAATRTSPVIDVCGALSPGRSPLVVHMDVNPEAAEDHQGLLAVPHPVAMLVSQLLHPLEQRSGVCEAIAVVLRPAADFGQPGVEELREQTVRLLSFAEVPVEIFGRQLAFNLLRDGAASSGVAGADSTVGSEVARLLGWPEVRCAVSMITAPVFHGHCIQLRCKLVNGATSEDVLAALSESKLFDPPGEGPDSPLEVSGEPTIGISRPEPDGIGGFWLWAVAGEAGVRHAELAVRLAAASTDL